jgi:hypothetical protein
MNCEAGLGVRLHGNRYRRCHEQNAEFLLHADCRID